MQCFLTVRGLATLALRSKELLQNTLTIYEALKDKLKISIVSEYSNTILVNINKNKLNNANFDYLKSNAENSNISYCEIYEDYTLLNVGIDDSSIVITDLLKLTS